ncbi:D-aminoacylase [Nocardioidaceae bacterium SCSIO 66511]|nr:D-aminoacylase [Nocardioidaceae bacterium SCSIO 66511]
MSTFDLLLRGGSVIDGTGASARSNDIGVRQGRIVVLPPASLASADRTIDASGLIVSPGFIDVHTHSDLLGGDDPERADLRLASVLQGVTTEICGNCGISAFPAEPARVGELGDLVAATFGAPSAAFTSLPEFAAAQGLPRRNNLATLVGHGALRTGVMGLAERPATGSELERMVELLDAALRDGAAGFSTGLIYPPGVYADTNEIVTLAKVAARHSKPYVTHLRDEMARVEEALEEAIEIARASGAALQVSHHKTAGKASWGATKRTLPRLAQASGEGIDVQCDVYPYTAGSTTLHAMLPPWAAANGIPAMLDRLRVPEVRARIRADIATGLQGWENTVGSNGGWHSIVVASSPAEPAYEGESVAELARLRGDDPVDFVCDALAANSGSVSIISRSMHEDDVRRVLANPLSMIASDGVPRPGKPHPRWAGTFVRVLGRYVRHEGLLPIETAVHKMTGMPAARFGIEGRGVIEDGAVADLVVWDSATVRDAATYDDPLARPRGVSTVIVAGRPVVVDDEICPVAPGRFLRVGGR